MDPDDFTLTREEAAATLGVSLRTFDRHVAAKALPSVTKIGSRNLFYRPADVNSLRTSAITRIED